jgi:hypothetical protein
MRVIVWLVLAAGLAGGAWWWAATQSLEARVMRICEEQAAAALADPRTYHRTGPPDVYRQPATFDDYMGWSRSSKRADDARRAEEMPEFARLLEETRKRFDAMEDPQEILIYVEYTGHRRLLGVVNAPSSCALVYDASAGTPGDAEIRRRLRFDGMTSFERAISGLR